MKKILLVLMILVSANIASAQTFAKGTSTLSLGIAGGRYNVPLAISYEHGIVNFNSSMSLGVGATAYLGLNNIGQQQFFGAEVNYHFTGIKTLDLYCGPIVGYDRYYNGWKTGFNVGANWYFSNSWGLNLEVGGGVTNYVAGFAYRF